MPLDEDVLLEQVDVVQGLEQIGRLAQQRRGVRRVGDELLHALEHELLRLLLIARRLEELRQHGLVRAHLLERVGVEHALEDEAEEVVAPAQRPRARCTAGAAAEAAEAAERSVAGAAAARAGVAARRRRGAARGGALQLVLLGDCHERLDCLGGLVALDGLLNLEADGALLELELVQLLLAVAVAVGLLHLRASIKLGVRIQSTSPLPAAGALAGCTGVAEHDGGGRAWLQASSCSSEPQP